MPEINQLLTALFLVALVLYLMPTVLRLGGSAERRRWFQRTATTMIGIAMAIAVVAALKWFIR
jgi:succinate dehydrogenase hydrophobic anchor subunit